MKHHEKLPIISLLALTVSGFIAIITETLPAGLLPQISSGIRVSEAYAGQFITLYALGSVLSAIPVISWTRNWNRKPLLLVAVAGFFVFNLTTFSLQSYYLLLAVRFMAGVCAGIIWGVLTGYTVRMVSPKMAGRALAIVGVGQPIALSLGVPLATWLGKIVGWNMIFFVHIIVVTHSHFLDSSIRTGLFS
ncbi:MFS transporter [Elizabethkingia sp. JS20170427COW]|uniref:MFS transporter n=1 Tax=Elizabethkingia sp. JS20170427COW TaxID=2583851 RepID=UPI002105E9A4|nr:MFS transporter [Elizabethkingia sp. JS20170427COW]